MAKSGLKKTFLIVLLAVHGFSSAEEKRLDTEFYASLRLGVDYVYSDTEVDAFAGRDYLSRIGVKASTEIDGGLSGIAHIEYGLRGEDNVHFRQNEGAGLRLIYAGIEGPFGRATYGSQTLVFHQLVRTAYFSDANDTLRQGAIRDDDLLQCYFAWDSFEIALGAQFKNQDGDSLDQYEIGAERTLGSVQLQGVYVRDNQGDLKGNLFGVRLWWKPVNHLVVSAYSHIASENFDLYAGGFTGNIRITDGTTEGSVPGVVSCINEERSSNGVYGRIDRASHSLHGRYAVDRCRENGDVTSLKGEYIYAFSADYRLWISLETLSSDKLRNPQTTSGEDMSEFQLGLRMDF